MSGDTGVPVGVSGAGHGPNVPPGRAGRKIIGWRNRVEVDGRVRGMDASGAIDYRTSEPVSGEALNALMTDAWPDHALMDPEVLARHSAGWVCAYEGERLVGFVNVAWDGATHFFLLDTTVAPTHQHRGIGTALVEHAVALSKARGGDWLHVDFDDHLTTFYRAAGFDPTPAGLHQLYTD